MEINKLLEFLALAEKLKCNTRHSWTSSGRCESVAEHSWRLALTAYLVWDEFPTADINKVILMCLVHDLGEAVTGDIPAFIKTQADEEKEEITVKSVVSELPKPYCDELESLFNEMNALESTEAKIYKALDKLETLISHNEADISTWLPIEYEANLTYGADEVSFSPYMMKLKETIKDISIQKMNESSTV